MAISDLRHDISLSADEDTSLSGDNSTATTTSPPQFEARVRNAVLRKSPTAINVKAICESAYGVELQHDSEGLVMEDTIFSPQYEMNSLDEFTTEQMAAVLGEEFEHIFYESNSSYPTLNPTSNTSMEASQTCIDERPTKQSKTNSLIPCITKHIATAEASPSSPIPFPFDILNSLTDPQQFNGNLGSNLEVLNLENMAFPLDVLKFQDPYLDKDHGSKAEKGTKRITMKTRSPSQSQDHIIAERQRREKLSQNFIALSAIIPGLKKIDKASVLGEATKYMKQLQERVKTLEEQTVKKTVESVVVLKKSQLLVDDSTSPFDENLEGCSDDQLPEIEARVSEKNILIRIHCEKGKGILVKTLAEIEKLHLMVVNSSLVLFGSSALDITIVAQLMEDFIFSLQCEMNSLDEFITEQMAAVFGEDFQHIFGYQSNSSYPTLNPTSNTSTTFSGLSTEASLTCLDERPTKQPKTDSLIPCITKHIVTPEASPSSPIPFPFDTLNSLTDPQQFHGNLGSTMEPGDEALNL
ncbi:hypothetical protein HHK36_009675 [Tetracentron sinense]|uniref:BHLH domain-containing protein n=1 Tax=Tetracentron sinense TaxID=13715 RepID=A0A834ZDP6_TETSI|nr:hypothetical protein HHK36_009675 [Tetracentron sinense]